MLRHVLAVVVIVATVVVVSKAEAADPTAQAFVDTVALGSIAMEQQRPQIRTSLEAVGIDRCLKVMISKVPKHAEDEAITAPVAALVQATYGPVTPVLRDMLAAMDRIPTGDPVLRSGRAAWRVSVTALTSVQPPPDTCRRLEAWMKRGWKRSARPKLHTEEFAAAMERLDSPALERKFDAAERRLRQLGVSAAEAELWSGETAFTAIEDELDAVFERLIPESTDDGLFDEPF